MPRAEDVPGTATGTPSTRSSRQHPVPLRNAEPQDVRPFVPGGGSAHQAAGNTGETWVGEIYALNSTADPIDNVTSASTRSSSDVGGQLAPGALGVDIFDRPDQRPDAARHLDLLGVGTAPAPAAPPLPAVIVKVDVDGAQAARSSGRRPAGQIRGRSGRRTGAPRICLAAERAKPVQPDDPDRIRPAPADAGTSLSTTSPAASSSRCSTAARRGASR